MATAKAPAASLALLSIVALTVAIADVVAAIAEAAAAAVDCARVAAFGQTHHDFTKPNDSCLFGIPTPLPFQAVAEKCDGPECRNQ